MAFTSHGHHILGSAMDGRPRTVARCGGVHLCKTCLRELALHDAKRIRESEIWPKDTVKLENEDSDIVVSLKTLIVDLESMSEGMKHNPVVEALIDRLTRILYK